MRVFSTDHNGHIRRRDVVASGAADDWTLAAATRDGELDRLYRGVYTPVLEVDGFEARDDRYRSRIRAAVSMGGAGKVVSHHSAAALHRLPILGHTDDVHFSVNRSSGGRRRGRAFVLHATPWESDEITIVNDVEVTSVARTAIDVARSGTFAEAVCVLDGARRRGASPEELAAVAERGR